MRYHKDVVEILRDALVEEGLPVDVLDDFYVTLTNHHRLRKLEKLEEELKQAEDRIFERLNHRTFARHVWERALRNDNRYQVLIKQYGDLAAEITSAMLREREIELNKLKKD
jgi:hypothetical protein